MIRENQWQLKKNDEKNFYYWKNNRWKWGQKKRKLFRAHNNMKSPCFTIFSILLVFSVVWVPFGSINYSILQIASSSLPLVLQFQTNFTSITTDLPQSHLKSLDLRSHVYNMTLCNLSRFVTHKKDRRA